MTTPRAYFLVAVRADALGRDAHTVEAVCTTAGRARELQRALLEGGGPPRRTYVLVVAVDRLSVLPCGDDEVLESSEEEGAACGS